MENLKLRKKSKAGTTDFTCTQCGVAIETGESYYRWFKKGATIRQHASHGVLTSIPADVADVTQPVVVVTTDRPTEAEFEAGAELLDRALAVVVSAKESLIIAEALEARSMELLDENFVMATVASIEDEGAKTFVATEVVD